MIEMNQIITSLRQMSSEKRAKYLIVTTAALLGGCLALGAYHRFFYQEEPKIPIVCVSQDLPQDTTLTIDVLHQKKAKAKDLPTGIVRAGEVTEVIGKTLRTDIPSGAPLLWEYIRSPQESANALLLPDQRALTLPAPAIAPFVQIGDYIDVLGLGRMLAGGIRIIGVQEENGTKHYTLGVSPKQAIDIVAAMETGSVSLIHSQRNKKKKKQRLSNNQIVSGLPL